MTRCILIRHGETDWNREGRWQGQADIPLNSFGLEQAERLAHELTRELRLDAIYSSDLQRARQTAEALARASGLPVCLDPRLREVNQGRWQGLLLSEIEARYSQIYHLRRQNPWSVAPPGGESGADVRRRAAQALSEIMARHPDATVALVAHGFILAVIQTIFMNESVENIWRLVPQNCTSIIINHTGGILDSS